MRQRVGSADPTPITMYIALMPSPPTKSSGFRGFDSSRLLILRGGILMSVNFDRGSPGKFDSRTLNRETLNRWTGHNTNNNHNNHDNSSNDDNNDNVKTYYYYYYCLYW